MVGATVRMTDAGVGKACGWVGISSGVGLGGSTVLVGVEFAAVQAVITANRMQHTDGITTDFRLFIPPPV